jgi:subtilisin family serine protease
MKTLWLKIVNADFHRIAHCTVRATTSANQTVELKAEDDRWVGHDILGDRMEIHVTAKGFEPQTHRINLRDGINQVVIGLRLPGQLSYTYGNDRLAFNPVNDEFLMHISGPNAAENFSGLAKEKDIKWRFVSQKAGNLADDIFLRVHGDIEKSPALSKELLRHKLNFEIFRIIEHKDRPALGLTNELVVRFQNDVKRSDAERLAASVDLKIKRELRHAGNAFVLVRSGNPSYDLINAADALAKSDRVVYVEPNLTFVIEPDQYTPNDPLYPHVPHLQLINVDDAWDRLDNVAINLRGGSPDITIAVIDLDGVAPNHPEFTASLTDGTSKLVSSTNFAASPIAAQTVAGLGGDHGTECAASATAAFDNNRGLAGVAPNCHLIGARIGGVSSAVLMADIYLWVAGFMNGSVAAGFPIAPPARAADVISSSWGSSGLALSNTIRDCFDFLTTYGRGGKGCILCFSLGNTGYTDFTDSAGSDFRAWPTYEKTLAIGSSINTNPTNPVASCQPDPAGNVANIATAVDRRALYSPYGATALLKPDLVSPSHTSYVSPCPPGTKVDPILSAVRVGTGTVDGCPGAAVCNDYAQSFGGTSHSTPTVAGAVALVLSARTNLNWVQVRDILRRSCVRIDAAQTNAIGLWQDLDGDTLIDYSRWYGAGRIDVDAAVELALDNTLQLADVYVRENLSDFGNVPSGGDWWESPDIWVRRNALDPIPALAWGDPAPHQNAKRGQDNAVFCRVRNRGEVTAPVVYIRAMITHWAGLEFVYPADFIPSNNVGAPIPSPLVPGTYLIGEARVDNLGPGADRIVKFNWPQALIPPETVVVSGATVHWHPCLLVEASPHDGPDPIGGLAAPVRGNNNISQRNIDIDNVGDAGADDFVGMIAGTRDPVGIATLIVDAKHLRGAATIRLHIADERLMKQFELSASRVVQGLPVQAGEKIKDCVVTLESRAKLRMECGICKIVIEAAPGSRIFTNDCYSSSQVTAQMVKHQGLNSIEIKGLSGRMEIPLRLSGGQFAPLLVAITGPATGDLRILQRRGDGELSGGYGIRRQSS